MLATSVLPAGMVAMLLLVLRPPAASDDEEEPPAVRSDDEPGFAGSGTAKSPVPNAAGGLTAAEKWRLARPLIGRFMLPLFAVYVFEYTINQVRESTSPTHPSDPRSLSRSA
jgi:battenin